MVLSFRTVDIAGNPGQNFITLLFTVFDVSCKTPEKEMKGFANIRWRNLSFTTYEGLPIYR